MNGLVIAGAIIALLGLAGIAVPYFTTTQTKDVAKIGSLHVQAQQDTGHTIPPLLSEGALALGVILMGAGLLQRR
jgi:hypothetical protein